MDKTLSQNNSSDHSGVWNFTNPWGVWGCLWRFIVFLIGILAFVLLLLTLKKCCGQSQKDNPDTLAHPIDIPSDTIIEDPGKPVEDWPGTIPDVPELPDSAHNFIEPFDSTLVTPNPEDTLRRIMSNQLIVLFNSKDIENDMKIFAQKFKKEYPSSSNEISYYNTKSGLMKLLVPQDSLLQIRDELPSKIPDVSFKVFTVDVFTSNATPSDPDFGNRDYSEYFELIQAYDAWDITRGDTAVKVAIVDSYFDLKHPEIGNRYVDPINIITQKTGVAPSRPAFSGQMAGLNAHGTHVAGIAIGSQDNNLGCSGIAPLCKWIPISVGDCMTTDAIVEGLMYAIYHGADVINMSLGAQFSKFAWLLPIDEQVKRATEPNKQDSLWDYVLEVANAHNCVIVDAAGNDKLLMGMDPQTRNELMVNVEAVDSKGIITDFTSFGRVDDKNINFSVVSAPGVKIWSSTYQSSIPFFPSEYKRSYKESLQEMDGTSMASPIVAGAVALLKSKNKNLTVSEIINILKVTAKQTDKSNKIGPTIQIKDALNMVGGEKMKFDDVMKDHNAILGRWKSTSVLPLVEMDNGKKIDELWLYLTFKTTDSGNSDYYLISSSNKYSTTFNVKWNTSFFEVTELTDASRANDQMKINKAKFVCKPDNNGYIQVEGTSIGTNINFYLEKVY